MIWPTRALVAVATATVLFAGSFGPAGAVPDHARLEAAAGPGPATRVFVDTTTPVGAEASQVSVATGDVDGDGRTDVVHADQWSQQPWLRIRLQTADGQLGPMTMVPSPCSDASGLVVGDVTGDARAEIMLGCYKAVVTFTRAVDGSWSSTRTEFGLGPWRLTVVDVAGDSTPDLIATERTNTWIVRGTSAGLGNREAIAGYRGDHPVTTDLNGDGHPDLIGREGTDLVSLITDDTQPGGFQAEVHRSLVADPPTGVTLEGATTPAVADFDGDGGLEAASFASDGTWHHWIVTVPWDGSSWGAPTHQDAGDGWSNRILTTADMNADGRPDLTTVNTYRDVMVALSGAGGFGPRTAYELPSPGYSPWPASAPQYVAVGDINSDGGPDLVTYDANRLQIIPHRAPNHAPAADDAAFTTPRDTPIAVAATGTDVDGDPLTVTVDPAGPAHGTLTDGAEGLTYQPAVGFVGTDTIGFTVADDWGVTDSGTISIGVTAVTPGPPAALTATARDGAARLSWGPPTDGGGASVDGYRVRRDGTEIAMLPGDAATFLDEGLTDGTEYSFAVSVLTSAGEGPPAAVTVTPRRQTFPHVRYLDVRSPSRLSRALDWAVFHQLVVPGRPRFYLPYAPMTRGRAATMLWRLAGAPGGLPDASFSDVPPNASYRDAVDWMVLAGIVTDGPGTSFRPDRVLSRGQSVSWLWQALGSASSDGDHPFTDVPSGLDAAFGWAHEHELISPVATGRVLPHLFTTRGSFIQLVHRAAGTPGAWSAWPGNPPPTARF